MFSPKPVLSAISLIALIVCSNAAASEPERVASVGPWPGASQLITYRDRIWFVNSSPFRDTNAADIYSHDPQTGTTRFERSLFSQDVGEPVVYDGLLHWPYEDPRRSAGTGEYAVTNGEDWRWQVMDNGHAMHLHALSTCADQLVGVTGSWTGQFLQKNPQTGIWDLRYDYPAGAAAFSRLVSVKEYKSSCYVAGSANRDPQVRLMRVDGNTTSPVPGWPASDRVAGLTVHAGALYGWSDSGADRKLLTWDGDKVTSIKTDSNHRVRDLHSNGNTLFMISSNQQQGTLWSLKNNSFNEVAKLPFVPISLTGHANKIYIGSYRKNGTGLWSVDVPDALRSEPVKRNEPTPLPLVSPTQIPDLTDAELEAEFQSIKGMITNPNASSDVVKLLRATLGRPANVAHPGFGDVLTRLLKVPLPDTTVTMFTGRELVWQEVVHWYLLHALSINGHGSIDTALLERPWTRPENRSQKYFDTTVAAIVATGWLGQNNLRTLRALINRLDKPGDPAWLQSDLTGALAAITGQPFGNDSEKWKRWWRGQN